MKKCIILLLIFAMVLPVFAGCSNKIDNSAYVPTGNAILMEGQDPEDIMPEEEDTQELTLAYYPNKSLNPIFGSDYTNRVLMSLMYQPLFAVDNQKKAYPILASGYRASEDSRTWVVYLDGSAKFSDGSRVTPEDVVATYTQARENDYYKYRFQYHLSKVEVTSDGGVAFYLINPIGNFPILLDVPIIKAGQVEDEVPLGTGPYTFQSGVSGSFLQRNPDWWCGSLEIPATDLAIELVEVDSPSQVRDEFQFGNVSIACTNPMSASFAEYRCDYELWEIESGYMMYIGCNIRWSDYFPERHPLREFLTYAIDREKLAQEVYRGMVYPISLPCSPKEVFYNKSLAEKFDYDSLKFLDELVSFNIPKQKKGNGQQTLNILVNSDDSARVQIARSLAKTLTELGLPAVSVEKNSSGFKSAIVNGNYDIYLGMTRLSPTMDLTEFFRPYGELTRGGLAHETLRDMSLRALEDNGNFYNFYKKLGEDGRIIPLMFGYYVVYAQRGIAPDLNPSRDNVFFYTIGKNMSDILVKNTAE